MKLELTTPASFAKWTIMTKPTIAVRASTTECAPTATVRTIAKARCQLHPGSPRANSRTEPILIACTRPSRTGYGLMVAQRWMVPQQKYDVIHYIREEYFREDNPEQFVEVTEDYLNSLPTGDTRGPEPVKFEPWVAMDYGPSMNQTFEITLNNSGKNIGRDLGRGPGSKDPWPTRTSTSCRAKPRTTLTKESPFA